MLVKIIIPVYNSEAYLKRCLHSLLLQTYQNYDIVLVDDGSTDASPQICDDYAKEYAQIHVLHLEHKGLSDARNAGIEFPLACEYLAFVDSDDWVHPRYLELLVSSIQNSRAQIAICGHVRAEKETPPEDVEMHEPTIYTPEACYCLTGLSTTPAWGKLYQAALFDSLRYPSGKIHEDYYVTWKAVFHASKIAVNETQLYYYFYNENGLMHRTWSPERLDFFPAMEEKILFFRKHRYFEAEKRAEEKVIKTAEKYIRQIEGTEYAAVYIPVIGQWKQRILEHSDSGESFAL